MKTLDPIKDAEFIQRHAMCARAAQEKRARLCEQPPEPEIPSAPPAPTYAPDAPYAYEWDDT